MVLNANQAKEKIQNPTNSGLIDDVVRYESALKVFTETMTENELANEIYFSELLHKIKTRSEKKYDRVYQFMRFPLPIVHISESILDDFYKIFDGKNRYFNITSTIDVSRLKDWTKANKPIKWVEKTAKTVFKNKPSTIIIVDTNETGNPYYFTIDTSRLIDIKFKDNSGTIEYITFIHSISENGNQNIALYNDVKFYVFEKDAKSGELTLIKEKENHLGYCPAKMFISDKINQKNLFKRKSLFSNAISKMEDWTIFDVFRNYVDHYAPFPVTETPIKKCPNPKCQNGFEREEIITNKALGTKEIKWHECPVCKGGQELQVLVGPGTNIGIKLNTDKTKEDGSGKFKMHFPDTDKMDYVPKKLDNLELEIRYKTVGVSQIMTKEAINKLQVKGSFQSMENVLLHNKKQLDENYIFLIQTAGGYLYPKAQIKVEADFGTEFYLISEEELQKRFEKAKEIGLPHSELILIYKQLIETKYKGNQNKINRQYMLLQLDEFPLYSSEECIEMFGKGVITSEELNFKINFYKFVQKFETDNIDIAEFGKELDMRSRIEKIKNELKKYNDENIKTKQPATS